MDLLDALSKLPQGPYTPKDRYHDFRKVFGSPEGQRAMREILSWCHMFKPSVYGNPIDPHLVTLKEGERNIGLKLLSIYHTEPPEKQERARRK